MLLRTVLAVSAFTVVAFSADPVIGSWKLNTAKSKYAGVPAPMDVTITYTPEGEGWKYEATGTAAGGRPINSSYVYARDNGEIKFMGYPYADALVLMNGRSNPST